MYSDVQNLELEEIETDGFIVNLEGFISVLHSYFNGIGFVQTLNRSRLNKDLSLSSCPSLSLY